MKVVSFFAALGLILIFGVGSAVLAGWWVRIFLDVAGIR